MATNDWTQYGDTAQDDDDEAVITTGDMSAGQTLRVTFRDDPETFDSESYGEGVRFPVTFHVSEYDFTHDGEDLEDGDDAVLLTWSSRMVRAISEATEGDVVDTEVIIEKDGEGYDTTYAVSVQ